VSIIIGVAGVDGELAVKTGISESALGITGSKPESSRTKSDEAKTFTVFLSLVYRFLHSISDKTKTIGLIYEGQ
jgi:hypothetical protein